MGYMTFIEWALFLSMVIMALFLINSMKNWYHTIMILMILEMMMIQNFFLLINSSSHTNSVVMTFVFSTLMVMGASLSMSVLTMISRSHGNDHMMIF